MKRRLLFLLVIGISSALPLSTWADVTLITTPDGLKFTVGMREKFVAFTNQNHDLMSDFNFRSFTSPDVAVGDDDWAIQNFANLLFTMEKGPLRIHANLEMEANSDAASTDVNNPNLERMALYYKIPDLGTLAAGLDVHAFDPEGALIYTDEHPGIWLVGGADDVSWDVAWHRVLDCQRGGTLFSGAGAPCDGVNPATVDTDSDQHSDIFMGRVNFSPATGWTISPMFVYYRRYVPQANLNEFSCPSGLCAGFPTGPDDSTANEYRPGMVVRGTVGPVTLTGEAVGLLGKIRDLSNNYLGGNPAGPGTDDYDLYSFAVFFEVALDGAQIGLPGWTPYVNFEWHRGDTDPFDDTYGGYTPISNLSLALRKDGFKGQSISSYGPPVLGANAEDGWGFDVTARGTGPSLGAILPDETLGSVGGPDDTYYNNRGGKGGNPGFFKASGGILGRFNQNWDAHFGISAFWYDQTEAIEAEAAQNQIALGLFPGLSPLSDSNVNTVANGISVDSFMGVEVNLNVGFNINNFRVQPFISVFIAGSAVEDINQAFLGDDESTTGFTGGVELSAAF
jgi:hypothetical protein